MLRCKTWVCNVDISYLKITVLIEESHFFKSVPKKSATGQKAMAWNHNKMRLLTVAQTLGIHKNFIRWTLVTRIILKPLNLIQIHNGCRLRFPCIILLKASFVKKKTKKIYIFIIGDLTCLVDLINRPVYNGRHVIDKYWG